MALFKFTETYHTPVIGSVKGRVGIDSVYTVVDNDLRLVNDGINLRSLSTTVYTESIPTRPFTLPITGV